MLDLDHSDHATADHATAGVIIDIRPRSRYRQHHIPGSHSIPSGWLISGELPEGDLILVGESSRHSALTIEHLQAHGYDRRIRHLAGGFAAWQQQGLPMISTPANGPPWPGKALLAWLVHGLQRQRVPASRCRARA
ncbi:MAG: hypothetical protein ER33_04850 [Cyanobium sp. CACIAM 14]|nr:MAG: hypothetical protein ER33_04850 [Cyanobium sp. CACIAM 14]